MGTYVIPRNLKGETRLLIIFSVKSLITTAIGAAVGAVFFLLIGKGFGKETAGWIALAICGVIGFGVGTIKIPTISGFPITKKIGGESIDEIIIRYITFKGKKKKYAYYAKKEENK